MYGVHLGKSVRPIDRVIPLNNIYTYRTTLDVRRTAGSPNIVNIAGVKKLLNIFFDMAAAAGNTNVRTQSEKFPRRLYSPCVHFENARSIYRGKGDHDQWPI